MEKIYANSEEKYLSAIVVYGNSTNELYSDKEFTVPVTVTDFIYLFMRNLVVIKDKNDYLLRPISILETEGVYMVGCVSTFADAPSTGVNGYVFGFAE